ncbi:UBTD2-like protein [Mya arenaria]|uniref:UBTD2-like protein n=1 Tax=Mya arenaria TaxID=6604 RepID=A0ABY7FT40_MYAAR|nr:ubiquitin domain-containing protein 2-like [Mya arenaria]WAR22376.1 UBTD2-like protein [Mya arenaria]
MGGCLGSNRHRDHSSRESSDVAGISLGRNQPLRPEKPKWKSDVPLTEGQLRSKRDEFWDTAPAFEGRKEIWDALKAAAYALETGDHALAQAIIDGASITLPHGTLMDCYDELGNRYQLPVYVLGAPTNLLDDTSENDPPQDNDSKDPPGAETVIKLRISLTSKDIKIKVRTTDTMLKIKKRLFELEKIEPSRQRLFYSGKMLNDKLKIEDVKIPKGNVVQVIVTPLEGEEIS